MVVEALHTGFSMFYLHGPAVICNFLFAEDNALKELPDLLFCPSVHCKTRHLWEKSHLFALRLFLRHFYPLCASRLVVVSISVTVMLQFLHRVDKRANKIIPIKEWDVRSLIRKLAMSLSHN